MERNAENESRFRTSNQRTDVALDDVYGDDPRGTFEAMCECALEDCAEMIVVDPDAYQHVRSHGRWFMVTPGHVLPDGESTIEEFPNYWIIEKLGAGGERAQSLA
ncbi:MAG: hypothetical protein JWM90_2342 [Thermoleophilia bacterium]|nr:hypothetical protein [Thermoleophilia bacterium]